MHTLVK